MLKKTGFVGQADADQRAARALRAVGQRRRHDPPGGDSPQLPQQFAGAIDQGVVQRDRDPLAGIDVVEDAALAQVAVLPQDQPLGAELDLLRLPGVAGHVGHAAVLVIDGDRDPGLDIDQVHLGDQALDRGREHQRTGMDLRGVGSRERGVRVGPGHVIARDWGTRDPGTRRGGDAGTRFGQIVARGRGVGSGGQNVGIGLLGLGHVGAGGGIDAAVAESAFEDVEVVGELALDPFEIGQVRGNK